MYVGQRYAHYSAKNSLTFTIKIFVVTLCESKWTIALATSMAIFKSVLFVMVDVCFMYDIE